MNMLNDIFQLCIVPLLGILTTYLIKFINKKNEEITIQTNNEISQKYIDMLTKTIIDCVNSTNQTYVDSLKNKNAFSKDAQEEAFKQTYEKVMDILSEDAKTYLTNAYGDLNIYITTKIEAEVKNFKINEKVEVV